MKKSKGIFVLLGLVVAIIITILTFITFSGETEKKVHKVSVIIQNSENATWSAFKYGLRMAAQDSEIELFIVNTGENITAAEEMEIIWQEIDNGADALIIQPVMGDGIRDNIKKIEKKVHVMFVEQEALLENESLLCPVTKVDDYTMGVELAENLLADYNGNIKDKTLGLMMDSDVYSNRKQGFQDRLKDSGAEIEWELENMGDISLEEKSRVDFVIAFDDKSLTIAGACSNARNLHGALVYGVGNSTEAVYYLDVGSVECLIVPDDFNMGYQSLAEISEKLNHFFYKMQSTKVDYTVIRRDDLFSEKNQNILFTMNQ